MQTFQEFCEEYEVNAKELLQSIDFCVKYAKNNFNFAEYEEIILEKFEKVLLEKDIRIDHHFCKYALEVLIKDDEPEYRKNRNEYYNFYKKMYLNK